MKATIFRSLGLLALALGVLYVTAGQPFTTEVALGFCLGLNAVAFACIVWLFRDLRDSKIRCPKCGGPPKRPLPVMTCQDCGRFFREHVNGTTTLEGHGGKYAQ